LIPFQRKARAMAKKPAKKTKAKSKATKGGTRKTRSKAVDAAVKEYWEKFEAWEAITHKVLAGSKVVEKGAARKVLAAQKFMELTGGYEEAFVILDAVMIAAAKEEEEQS
jgi:hypothetical protein